MSARASILRTSAVDPRLSVVNLETDIQACWVLKALCSTSDPDPMTCKDSTSLSKVHGIVDRLSEDGDAMMIHRSRN